MHVFSYAIRRTAWTVIILAVALFLGVQQSQAQDHHLFVSAVWATPDPLGCPSEIAAMVTVLGDKDYEINSGDAKIKIYYRVDGGTWLPIGNIPIVWAPSDGGLSKWDKWQLPRDFPSEPDNTIEFQPTAEGVYEFRGETIYPDGITGVPSDRISEKYTVGQPCPSPPRCIILPGTIGTAGGSYSVICPPDGKFCTRFPWLCPKPVCEKYPLLCPNMCLKYPWLCPHNLCERFPILPGCGGGGWGGGIDPCIFGLQCPDPLVNPFPVEVLFDNRINKFNLAVIDTNGRIAAEMKQLTRPMKVGGSTYNQRLQYIARPGEEYRIIYWSSGKIKTGEQMPFPLLIRPMKPGKRQR